MPSTGMHSYFVVVSGNSYAACIESHLPSVIMCSSLSSKRPLSRRELHTLTDDFYIESSADRIVTCVPKGKVQKTFTRAGGVSVQEGWSLSRGSLNIQDASVRGGGLCQGDPSPCEQNHRQV